MVHCAVYQSRITDRTVAATLIQDQCAVFVVMGTALCQDLVLWHKKPVYAADVMVVSLALLGGRGASWLFVLCLFSYFGI